MLKELKLEMRVTYRTRDKRKSDNFLVLDGWADSFGILECVSHFDTQEAHKDIFLSIYLI